MESLVLAEREAQEPEQVGKAVVVDSASSAPPLPSAPDLLLLLADRVHGAGYFISASVSDFMVLARCSAFIWISCLMTSDWL